MHNNLKRKYYFINNLNTKNIDNLDKQTAVIYRNYRSDKEDIFNLIKIRNYCRKKKIKFYLSNNFKLAIRLNLDGAYIPSFNREFSHLNYSTFKKFEIIGSAHNIKEIRIKELQKVNKIFLSSLFKKNRNFLGINKFKLLTKLTKKPAVALGGISTENMKKFNIIEVFEFAGISFFEQKKGP